ncbi:hypothetical protein [Aureimonas leprariae]|uniref:hypothetical protein n=1 Tax=Plantimonas leprariae TaxID=2615207 RepID=UPI001387006B|nr:hypothetical protein [Aureimonas leprariae]
MISRCAKTLTVVFAISAITPAVASTYCSEASAPSCASRYGPFDDEDDFERCKRQMDSYKSEVESYSECQRSAAEDEQRKIQEANRQIEEAAQENTKAISEFNEAVETFNRRARGY